MPRKTPVKPRKQPLQGRSRFTVDAILGAAAQILGTLGFDSATTNRIAEKAGISIGSLYQYFPNKESLAGALVDRKVEEHSRRFEKLLAELRGSPARAMIEAMVGEILPLYLDNRKLLGVLLDLIPSIDRVPGILQTRRRVCSLLAAEFRARADELRPRDPELAAFVVVNAIMGVIQTTIQDKSGDRDTQKLAEELVELIESYLLKR